MANNTSRKTRTVKKAAAKDADPLDNAECRAELAEDLRIADLEVKNGPDGEGWQHNEALRPAITERAAFYRALIKLLPCLLLFLAFACTARAGAPLAYSDAPQTGESPSVYEARAAMYLYNLRTFGISLTSTSRIQLWDGTNALAVGADGSLTVNVANFPATQPVSAGSLPLPNGAATAANQSALQTTLNTIAANTANTLSGSNSYRNLTASGTTVIKSGAGLLHAVTINSLGTTASVVTIYDATSAGGTKIGTINTLTLGGTFFYDVAFATGLTITATGLTAPDVTVSYR